MSESATGKVVRISTDANGKTTVLVQGDNMNETFEHPAHMTDEQLEEFKRAQNHDKKVAVDWDKAPRKVISVAVFNEGMAIRSGGPENRKAKPQGQRPVRRR
jgi:hypothetical protein